MRDRTAGGHDDPEPHLSGTHSRPPGPDRMELKDSHKPVDDFFELMAGFDVASAAMD